MLCNILDFLTLREGICGVLLRRVSKCIRDFRRFCRMTFRKQIQKVKEIQKSQSRRLKNRRQVAIKGYGCGRLAD